LGQLVKSAALAAAMSAIAITAVPAADMESGLWKVITRMETGGVIGPPHENSKCFTEEQTHDLATTFSTIPTTINSVCSPIERNLNGDKLTWRLECKGQLDMELTGDFTFDSPHHYSATVHTKATMGGMPMVDSQMMSEGQWVSACPQ
jgi:hypothetical protein